MPPPPESLQHYRQRLRIGRFEVDPGALTVQGAEGPIRLKPKAMAVLVALARHPGVTLTRDELLDQAWGSTHVTPGVVAHAITALRRAFGDPLDAPQYVETIPRIGYRLVAPVEWLPDAAPAGGDTAGDAVAAPVSGVTDPICAPAPLSPDGDQPGPRPAAAAPSAARGRRRRWLILAVALALAGMAALAAAWFGLREPGGIAAVSGPLVAADQRRITFETGIESDPRLNAAGDWLVYVGQPSPDAPTELALQSAHGTTHRALLTGERVSRPAWSADGRRVAYAVVDGDRCALRIVGIDDGARERVLDCPPGSQLYFDWHPADPTRMVFAQLSQGQLGGSRLASVVHDGTWRVRRIDYRHADNDADVDPRFSPDGSHVAFRRGGNPTSDIYLLRLADGAVTRLTKLRARINGMDWLPDGAGIVFSSDHAGHPELYAVDVATAGVQALGIRDAVNPDVARQAWAMTYQLEDWRTALGELTVRGAQAGRQLPLAESSGRDGAGALSPDDRNVAFASNRDGAQQLWLLDRTTARLRRMSEHPDVTVDTPHWSPDGTRVLYTTRGRGQHQLWELDVAEGRSRSLVSRHASLRNAVYAADGRSLWYAAWDGRAWSLHGCVRPSTGAGCTERAIDAVPAWRVDRARLDDRDMLVVSSPIRSGSLALLDEATLQPLRQLELPVNDGWAVSGDEIWYFQALDTENGGVAGKSLHTLSLRDGAVAERGRFPGLRFLRFTAPMVAADRTRVIVPLVLEHSADVGHALLRRPPAR